MTLTMKTTEDCSSSGGGAGDHNHHDEAISKYLLHRTGLLSDEIDWPATKLEARQRAAANRQNSNNNDNNNSDNKDNSVTSDKNNNGGGVQDDVAIDEVSNGAWRVRDPIYSIVGRDGYVQSETGLTNIATIASSATRGAGGIGGGDASEATVKQQKQPLKNIGEDIMKSMLPSHPEIVEFLTLKNKKMMMKEGGDAGNDEKMMDANDEQKMGESKDDADAEYNLSCSQRGKINIQHVHAAFNAAAYSIVRGNKCASMEGKETKDDNTGLSSSSTKAAAAAVKHYEPPLIHAFESIRSARMTSLSEASGKSVPSFLKKNNSIPWFHTPVDNNNSGGAVTGTGSANSGTKESSSSNSSQTTPMKTSTAKDTVAKPNIQVQAATATVAAQVSSSADVTKKRSREPDNVTSISNSSGSTTTFKSPLKKRIKATADVASKKKEQQEQEQQQQMTTVVETKSKMKSPTSATKKDTSIKSTPKGKTTVTPKRSPSSALSATSSSQKKGKTGSPSRGSWGSASASSTKQYSANTTRAILCAAASLVFKETTPNYVPDDSNPSGSSSRGDEKQLLNAPWNKGIDPKNIPQNTPDGKTTTASSPPAKTTKKDDFNMVTVLDQAKLYAKRTAEQANGAAHSSDRRREFLMDSSLARVGMGYDALTGRYHHAAASSSTTNNDALANLVVSNPFAYDGDDAMTDVEGGFSDDNQSIGGGGGGGSLPKYDKLNDTEWIKTSKPRLLSILRTGAGNAILHDKEWTCRAFRVVNLLQNLAVPRPSSNANSEPDFAHWNDIRLSGKSTKSLVRGFPNYGPHLIVTPSGQDFDTYVAAFHQLGSGSNRVSGGGFGREKNCRGVFKTNPDEVKLKALAYRGDKSSRRRVWKHFANSFGGLPDSTYHVVVTTYADFVEDYTHFCQVPFQAVVMDDGMSWLGCAHYDPQGDIGKVWNSAIWSNKSTQASNKKEGESKEESKLHIGLTARHRILVASCMHAKYRGQVYKAPVPGLLTFLTPQFTDVIREDWERCKLYNCKKSMEHIRSLLARSMVVYSGGCSIDKVSDLYELSLASINGELPGQQGSIAHEDDELDEWVKRQKIVQTRKFAAAWFRPLSPMRKSFGKLSLDSIIATMKRSNALGFVCQEIVTASSLTMSGQNGNVVGLGAYRAAVRCGRLFNSEAGLRQHILASHAPPDTWLCRNCGEDCGTSQARSHHERSCGTEEEVKESFGGGVPSVGKAPKSRGPKKKIAKNLAAAVIPDKDDDGSSRVLGYRGVWRKNGKYFIKIGGVPVTNNVGGNEVTLLLDTCEEAAKRYDHAITTRGRAREVEMNYRDDGSRIVYDDKVNETPEKSTDTAAVVPALAVINIKDLPKHVKPLLRDPNQTSRTGGNSKRYVYAYRGVCRQQRKGHDRWQSQISFNGQNHYLGTFDSEWDAAAVYAWAHLILYGEEATKQAQREGEEAAAKFEQRKKDIAEGKSPDQKPTRKKKTVSAKKQKATSEKVEQKPETTIVSSVDVEENSPAVQSKRQAPVTLKDWNKLKLECAQMLSSGTKGTSKATILGTRKDIADKRDISLHVNIPGRIGYGLGAFLQSIESGVEYSQSLPACISLNTHAPPHVPHNCALLIGLQASDFSWQLKDFVTSCQKMGSGDHISGSSSELYREFGVSGVNAYFRTMLISSPCVLGRASNESQQKYSSMHALSRIGANVESTLGMTIGDVDCNINGPKNSCSTKAAKIIYMPSKESKFRISACNDEDIVTINGKRIVSRMGGFPLKNRDVCSVGARVFVFIDAW